MRRNRVEQLELQLKEERKYRDEIEMVQRIIGVGLNALSLRMLATLVLVADCVLFAWAIGIGTWQALIAAVLFAVVTWCVLHLRPPNVKEKSSEQEPQA